MGRRGKSNEEIERLGASIMELQDQIAVLRQELATTACGIFLDGRNGRALKFQVDRDRPVR
jgi:hypothetical protein